MRFRHLAIAIALVLPAAFAEAELPVTVKIGIRNDMNGPFADQSGKGSVVTAQMAAEDFAEAGGGFKVEILSADHLNKPDVGAQIVRAWVDRDGVYSSVLAYLKAVKSANSIVGEDVVLQMRKQPIEDKLFGTVTVRQDGRAVHDMYTFKAESKARWDDYTVLARISGDQAFRPLNQGGCKLVTN